MTQTTRVYRIARNEVGAFDRRMRERLPNDAEWRTVPHARFSVKTAGVVLTCYESGKIVLQGRDAEVFESRFLEDVAVVRPAAPSSGDALAFDAETIGSDEAGKGDYFGPLVVAACHATLSDEAFLAEIGVADSKTLDDQRAKRLAGAIEAELDHEVVVMEPSTYNRRYAEIGNLNILLADMHADALSRLAGRHATAETFVVDRFAKESLVATALRKRGVAPSVLVQVPRAERHPVVAAASILARAAFLDGLARCEEECGSDLHKGAGAPVDVAARRVVAVGGRELLATVAKLHFKNTGKAGVN